MSNVNTVSIKMHDSESIVYTSYHSSKIAASGSMDGKHVIRHQSSASLVEAPNTLIISSDSLAGNSGSAGKRGDPCPADVKSLSTASIDKTPLEAAKIRLQKAKAYLEDAKARLSVAWEEHDIIEDDYNAASDRSDAAKARYVAAKQRLAEADALLEIAKAGVNNATLHRDQRLHCFNEIDASYNAASSHVIAMGKRFIAKGVIASSLNQNSEFYDACTLSCQSIRDRDIAQYNLTAANICLADATKILKQTTVYRDACVKDVLRAKADHKAALKGVWERHSQYASAFGEVMSTRAECDKHHLAINDALREYREAGGDLGKLTAESMREDQQRTMQTI